MIQQNFVAQGSTIGRPLMPFDPDIAEKICELVMNGLTICSICQMDEMPDIRTVWKWMESHEEFMLSYNRARTLRAEIRVANIDIVCEAVIDERIDSTSARVIIDAQKWQAGKENQRLYGDKMQVESNVNLSVKKAEEELRKLPLENLLQIQELLSVDMGEDS